MHKHTPGPWAMSDRGFAVMTGDMEIAAMNLHLEEWRSNARLIAAAPDMLDACEAAQALLNIIDKTGNYESISIGVVLSVLKSAIAKATGE